MSNESIEIIVPVVTQAPDYHLNPVFDQMLLFGWPVWIYVFLVMGIIFAIIWVKWLRRRMILSPVSEYLSAFKAGALEDMQTWLLGKNKSFYIKHLSYHDDGVISYPLFLQKISMWYLASSMAVGHAGGIKSIMVSDNYDTVRDPIAECALTTIIDEYNEIKKEPAKDSAGATLMDENGNIVMKYPISNYSDYEKHRKDIESMFPLGVKISTYTHYNVLKAQQFMPANRTAGMMGADCIREARKKNIDAKEDSPWLKFAPLGVAMIVGVLSIIFVYVFTTGGN